MSFDPSVLVTLYDPKINKILHTIVRQKTARLKDLVSNDISEEETLRAIEQLKSANLIKESPSPIPDLATYFITASGLLAGREVKG